MNDDMRLLIRETAEEAAQRATRETLLSLGIDLNNPLEVQRDLAALSELRAVYKDPEFLADMMHLRKWRKSVERIQSRSLLSAVKLVTLFIIGLLGLGLVEYLRGKLNL